MKDPHFKVFITKEKFCEEGRDLSLAVQSTEWAFIHHLAPMAREELAEVAKTIITFLAEE